MLIDFRRSSRFTCNLRVVDLDATYLILRGALNDLEITVVNYYAPNMEQVSFFETSVTGGISQ